MSRPDVTSMKRRRRSQPGISTISLIWLLACVSAGLWIMSGRSAPTPNVAAGPAVAQAPSLVAEESAATAAKYRPIEQLHVGKRVVTPGTEAGGSLPTAVDPATWRLLTPELVSTWPDGTRDQMHVRTLQPPQWVAAHHVQVGARVPIPLDLREMGVPTNQPAEVAAVDPCPAIEDGPGRVVLTTVSHLNSFLFDLKVHGARAPPQSLEVTGWHKLFSEDRQAWTSVCELRLGEVLRGRDGPLTVESLTRHPGVARVYNLTVEAEHQYYVLAADLLAHNANCVSVPQAADVPVSLTIRGQAVRWKPHTLNTSELRLVDPNAMRGKQLAKFLEDVKANGIQDPLKYVTLGGEKYVVQGSNRLRAAVLPEINIPTVPAVEVTLPFRGYRTAEDVLIDNATARWGFGMSYKR